MNGEVRLILEFIILFNHPNLKLTLFLVQNRLFMWMQGRGIRREIIQINAQNQCKLQFIFIEINA